MSNRELCASRHRIPCKFYAAPTAAPGGSIVGNRKLQSELTRLLKEQNTARQEEVFGGLSRTEQAECDSRMKRIHELAIELQTKRDETGCQCDESGQQKRQWNRNSETDTPQNDARQPYRSREKDSGDAFTDSLKTSRGKRKGHPKEGSA
jgi:hypothetical protein